MSSIVTVEVDNIKKDIVINKFEEITDFKSRIASEYGTLPRLLYFNDVYNDINEIINSERPVILTDVLREANKTPEFYQLYTKLKEPIKEGKVTVRDVLLLTLINSTIEDRFLKILTQESLSRLELGDIDYQTVEDIIDNKRNELQVLTETIEQHKVRKMNNDRKLKTFFEGRTDFITTDFQYESVQLQSNPTTTNPSLMELFNRVKTSEFTPFSNIKLLNIGGGNTIFSKIFKETLPYKAWSATADNTINLKVLDKMVPLKTVVEDYSNVLFVKENDIINVSMTIPINKISQEDYINRVGGAFVPSLRFKNIKEINITGTYNLMNQTFDKHVMADLVMNSVLQKYAVSNESVSATKVKNSVFVYFDIPNIGKAKVNFTPKVVTRKDFVEGYELGTPYVRIRVKEIENEDKLNLLLEFINNFFTYYNNEYDRIVAFYKQYIPGFGKEKVIIVEDDDKTTLKKQVPELFISGYSGQCPKNKNPVIIPDYEVQATKRNGIQVMTYPKLEDDSGKSMNYICTDEKYSYPGLQKNNLSNKGTFKYLPCCFSKDQTSMTGSNYRAYYLDEIPDKTDKKKRYILQSNKSVGEGEVATLPDNLNDLFTILNKDENIEYLRKGVRRSSSSFLECVVTALGYEIPLDMNVTRETFANSQTIGACRQEMYDFSNTEIVNILKSENYLDPKLFIHLLEEQFNCNIFLFSSVKKSDGEMVTPRFIEGYYQNFNKKPYVLIYENSGSKSENLPYPQCEIIILYNKSILTRRNIQENFEYDTSIVSRLSDVFNNLCSSYCLKQKVKKSKIRYPDYSMIVNQVTDTNGKCRKFNFKFKNNIVTMYTAPLQPISVESVAVYPDNKVTMDIVIELCSTLGIIIMSQSIDTNDNVKFLNGNWEGVDVSFPVLPQPKYNYIKSVVDTSVFQDEVLSSYSTFIRNQKNARYISEYFLWFYSSFIKTTGSDTTLSSIVDFVEERVKVDSRFVYGDIQKQFSLNAGTVVRDGKLVLTSDELLKRLIFYLKLMIIRNKPLVVNYYTYEMIQHYYINVTDFTKYQNQIVLEGEEAVENFLMYTTDTKILSKRIKPLETKPYFFKNSLLGPDMKLIQNTESYEYALELASVWNVDGYNNSPLTRRSYTIPTNVTLYSYKNENDITRYSVERGMFESKTEDENDVDLIGYKYKDKAYVSSLFNV